MPPDHDAVDQIRGHLRTIHPDLDTSGFGVTGRILRQARAIEAARVDHLDAYGLSPGDFDVLATVRRVQGDAGVNPGRLLQSVLITSGGLTKRLDRLEKAELLVRRPDPEDRRATLVRLTARGLRLIDAALQSLLEAEGDRVRAALTDRQMEQLASLLRRLDLDAANDV